MLKLKGYLKPFLVGILIAVVLLFVQAISELNLPNLMSNIVNVGIQQGGVEDSTPEVLSQDGYTFITSFMNDEEKALLEKNYTLVGTNAPDAKGRPLGDTYPKAADEQIYQLDLAISAETRAELDGVFGNATWTMVNLLKQVQTAQDEGTLEDTLAEQVRGSGDLSKLESLQNIEADDLDAAAGGDTDGADIQSLDLEKVYAMQPLFDLLPQEWYDDARDQALNMDPSLREQSGTMLVSGFYTELGADMDSIEINYILRIGLFMVLITLLSGVATVLVGFISSRIGAGVARNLRNDIFKKIAQFSHHEFDKFSTASLITRSTNDVTQLQMVVMMSIRMLFYAPIMGIGGIVMALEKSVSMSWIIALGVLVMLCIIVVVMVAVMPKFRIIQILIDKLNLVARETLNGLMVIRAFSRSGFEKDRFETANERLTKTNLFVNRAMTFMMPAMMLLMNGLTILIIWVGSHQVAASTMQVGDMMAYMQYAMQVLMSFMIIAMLFVFIPRAAISAERIAEVLETEPSIKDPTNPQHIDPAQKGRIEFRDVCFRYEGAEEDALAGLSFVAHPGETTAFIGSTGSGKSTILNLIPRFYDTTAGEVLVDGVNVRDVTQHELRSHIGYVPQKSVLLAGTIKSNIAYGNPNLTPDEMEEVTAIAQATDFIAEKDEHYAFEIAQGGTNVSGGQRQRLSIARALAIKPDIFLFDDSFSALDMKTDVALRKALVEHTAGSTILVVAQRVSTIMDADQIYVIDDGKMVGQGTHQELLKTCDAYYEIASSQLSPEELEGSVT